jgi:hypothetical protein
VDVRSDGLGRQRLEFRPGPGLPHLPALRDGEGPLLQRGARRRAGRQHRKAFSHVLTRRDPARVLVRGAVQVTESPRDRTHRQSAPLHRQAVQQDMGPPSPRRRERTSSRVLVMPVHPQPAGHGRHRPSPCRPRAPPGSDRTRTSGHGNHDVFGEIKVLFETGRGACFRPAGQAIQQFSLTCKRPAGRPPPDPLGPRVWRDLYRTGGEGRAGTARAYTADSGKSSGLTMRVCPAQARVHVLSCRQGKHQDRKRPKT